MKILRLLIAAVFLVSAINVYATDPTAAKERAGCSGPVQLWAFTWTFGYPNDEMDSYAGLARLNSSSSWVQQYSREENIYCFNVGSGQPIGGSSNQWVARGTEGVQTIDSNIVTIIASSCQEAP